MYQKSTKCTHDARFKSAKCSAQPLFSFFSCCQSSICSCCGSAIRPTCSSSAHQLHHFSSTCHTAWSLSACCFSEEAFFLLIFTAAFFLPSFFSGIIAALSFQTVKTPNKQHLRQNVPRKSVLLCTHTVIECTTT